MKNSTQSFPGNRRGSNTPVHFMKRVSPDTETRQEKYKQRAIQICISHEYKCKGL